MLDPAPAFFISLTHHSSNVISFILAGLPANRAFNRTLPIWFIVHIIPSRQRRLTSVLDGKRGLRPSSSRHACFTSSRMSG